MIQEQLTEVLKERIRNADELQNNWGDGLEQCWKKEIAILSADVPATIDYLLHDCTGEEFFWISEVFPDLPETVLSKELINAMRTRLNAIKPEEYHPDKFHSKTLQDWGGFEKFIHRIQYDVNLTEGVLDYILWKKETEGTEAKE